MPSDTPFEPREAERPLPLGPTLLWTLTERRIGLAGSRIVFEHARVCGDSPGQELVYDTLSTELHSHCDKLNQGAHLELSQILVNEHADWFRNQRLHFLRSHH